MGPDLLEMVMEEFKAAATTALTLALKLLASREKQ